MVSSSVMVSVDAIYPKKLFRGHLWRPGGLRIGRNRPEARLSERSSSQNLGANLRGAEVEQRNVSSHAARVRYGEDEHDIIINI